ncbi:uncharacterized protein LOC131439407 [Malaya genurostris]|uniref:uncharacterized protein LOC131439407 n=1 Tax=Malaya genurostris TaxID=325434 RepID=UPI0026F3F590|nr:uncharacterized protein LOC131439407 [Malaya genurostris]
MEDTSTNKGKFTKGGDLGGSRHGDTYRILLLMMVYGRAVDGNDYCNFRWITQCEAAGSFDGAVLAWDDTKTKSKHVMFIQVTNKTSVELNQSHFFPVDKAGKVMQKGEFSLYKYLLSYISIKENSEFTGCDLHFAMFTNAGIDKTILDWFTEANLPTVDAPGLLGSKGSFLKIKYVDSESRAQKLSNFVNSLNSNEREYGEQFLQEFTFAINQPSNDELKNIIRNGFWRQSSMDDSYSRECYAKLMFTKLQELICKRLESDSMKEYLCRDDLSNLSQDVNHTLEGPKLKFPLVTFQDNMNRLLIEYSDCSPLRDLCDFPVTVLTSTDQGLLTCLKLFQVLPKNGYQYFSLEDLQLPAIHSEFFSFIHNPTSDFILLQDNCSGFRLSTELLESILANVKLIFITPTEERAKFFFGKQNYTSITDSESSLIQLEKSIQEKLLQRSVLFQGVELALKELPSFDLLKDLVKNETLEKLILNKTIKIGPVLPDLPPRCYIPRTISRGEYEDCHYYDEKQFLDKISQTHASEELILLSSIPGMGKTTLGKSLALLAKETFRSKWILYISLLDCAKNFETFDVAKNLEDAIHFLQDVLLLKSNFEKSLLSKWLQRIPDSVYIFFDGYDELPVETMDRAITLFRILKNARVFVSTRSHLHQELEQQFNTKSYTLDPLKEHEQIELIKTLLEVSYESYSEDMIDEMVEQLMVKIKSQAMQTASEIVGIPLLISMLVAIYKQYRSEDDDQTNENHLLPDTSLDSLDILKIFEMFVYHSFKQHIVKRLNLDEKNPHTAKMLDPKYFLYEGFVKLHNFLGLMSLIGKRKMHFVQRNKQELESLEKQTDKFLDSRLVSKTPDGDPHFFHKTIAEFFSAKYLYENLRSVESEEIEIGKAIYQVVLKHNPMARKFFLLLIKLNEIPNLLNKLEQTLEMSLNAIECE